MRHRGAHLVYEDVEAAIEYLTRVFGFAEHYRYGVPPQGALMRLLARKILTRLRKTGSTTDGEGVPR